MRRRQQRRVEADEVIDLRDRLAPYDDVAALPRSQATPVESAKAESFELFTPLEFDFEYRMGHSPRGTS